VAVLIVSRMRHALRYGTLEPLAAAPALAAHVARAAARARGWHALGQGLELSSESLEAWLPDEGNWLKAHAPPATYARGRRRAVRGARVVSGRAQVDGRRPLFPSLAKPDAAQRQSAAELLAAGSAGLLQDGGAARGALESEERRLLGAQRRRVLTRRLRARLSAARSSGKLAMMLRLFRRAQRQRRERLFRGLYSVPPSPAAAPPPTRSNSSHGAETALPKEPTKGHWDVARATTKAIGLGLMLKNAVAATSRRRSVIS